MAQIGVFKPTKTGLSGRIRTPAFDPHLVLLPIDRPDAETAPDYRIHLGENDGTGVGPGVGAGWKCTRERAGESISLQRDDPSFAQPLRTNPLQAVDSGAEFRLLWSRSPRRHEAE
jgi:uncharacterized protein (DUF736 family)